MFREAELKERKKRIEPLTVGQIERYRREKERDGLNEVLLNWMEGAWRACPVVHNRRGKKYPRSWTNVRKVSFRVSLTGDLVACGRFETRIVGDGCAIVSSFDTLLRQRYRRWRPFRNVYSNEFNNLSNLFYSSDTVLICNTYWYDY